MADYRSSGQGARGEVPHLSPRKVVVYLVVSIFVTEALLMIALSAFPPMPALAHSFLDALLLSLIILPFLYSFVLRPLLFQIERRKAAEKTLLDRNNEIELLNANLEKKVERAVEELSRKDHVMMHQARLAAMGEMIGLIAHQWRQPLNALNLILYNVKEVSGEPVVDYRTVEEMTDKGLELIEKMSTTIDDFRNFFKPVTEKGSFDINKTVKETLSLMEAGFKFNNISLSLEEKDQVTTFGRKNEYSQVLLNVLNNAKDAIAARGPGSKGEIAVSVAGENGRAVVRVRDNGGGILDNALERLFEPYFSTKEKGKGTGLGLYMAKIIIEDHMTGDIRIYNRGEGAECLISTPLSD